MKNYKKNTEYEILTPDGFKDFDGVQLTKKDKSIKFRFSNDNTLGCSYSHKIDTPTGYKYADDLHPHDLVLDKNEQPVEIIEKNCIQNDVNLYDLINVDDERHRFIANDTIVSNCAFVPANIWHEFWESTYPTIASAKTSKIILVSTPKGMNHYYKMWRDAEEGRSRFNPVEVNWFDVPGYDEEFKDDTIANMGIRKWTQEFLCQFLASSNSIIDSKNMEEMEFANPLRHERVPLYGQIRKLKEQFVKSVAVYEKPKKGHEYVIGVDPAKITEDSSGDSLAMQIMDITRLPFKQVATVVINDGIHYLEVPAFLAKCGYYYNEAWIFIENNDQVGLSIADSLNIDWEYENVFSEKSGVFGFRTTAKSKKMSCLAIKMLIETNKLKIRDTTTISQLSTYIKKGNSYEAEMGYADDAVSALIGSMYFLQDRMGWEHKINLVSKVGYKQSLADIDPRLIREKQKVDDRKELSEEEPMPFGFANETNDVPQNIFSQSTMFGNS